MKGALKFVFLIHRKFKLKFAPTSPRYTELAENFDANFTVSAEFFTSPSLDQQSNVAIGRPIDCNSSEDKCPTIALFL